LELARETLYDFPDGVFFVALAPLEDTSTIAVTVVQALGFAETENKPPIERLKEGIGNKQMLLVLDNLEHIIEDSALLISELLTNCHYLKIVTTSREALRVSGEWLYPLPALNIPTLAQLQSIDGEGISQFPALTLFAERARAVRPDFVLDAENSETVANICTQLDGLPLAIELIAARIALMSPETLLERLNNRFILYADGMRAVSARQKTLHGAIAWSYDLLSPEEQKLFASLSIFAGGFTLDAAESIFSRMILDKPVSDLIASLSNKSLLQRTFDARGEPRFNMLVTIQQFAHDRLRQMADDAEIRNWHLAYFLRLAEQADKEIHGPDQIEWIERVESEHDNLNVALDWCVSSQKTESALRLFCGLGWIWGLRGHYTEARGWFDKIRAMPGLSDYPGLYAKALHHIGTHYYSVTDFNKALPILEESQAIWLQMGVEGELGLAACLRTLGAGARSTEQGSVVAKSYFDRSLELYQKHEDHWGLAHTIHLLGINANDQQQYESALSMFEQSIALFGRIGDSYGIARVSLSLAQVYLNVGNYKKARMSLEQGLILAEKIQFRLGMELALGSLGDLNRYQGRYREAEEFYKRSLALCHEYGLKGDMGWNLQQLGLLALHQDNYSLARQYFTNCYDLVSRIYEKDSAYNLISGLAAVAGGTNQPERAAKLSGAAQTIRKTIDIAYPPLDSAELDRHIQIARAQLGEQTFETLQAEGRAMTMEHAVEFALQEAK
jgi:predicted ATPase